MCMSLSDEIAQIIRINKQRWEIEEYLQIIKRKFQSKACLSKLR